MFLIIHNNDKGTLEFQDFAQKQQCSFISISLQELIEEVAITDSFSDGENKCLWRLNNQNINFSQLTGIYNRFNFFPKEYFDSFIPVDREYARTEWSSYLMYRLFAGKNILNPMTLDIISGKFFQSPYQFNIANKCGFTVPEYFISTDRKALLNVFSTKSFISKNKLNDLFNLKRSNDVQDADLLLVEYFEGDPIFVHIIKNNIFSTKGFGKNAAKIEIPVDIQDKVINITRKMGLSLSEIVFKLTKDGRYVFYYISNMPVWSRSAHYGPPIWQSLINALGDQ